MRDLGIYVHLPFCPHVCPYCDFAVEAVGPSLGDAAERSYVEALSRELELLVLRFQEQLEGRRLETLYLGGGTPSLLSPSALERIVDLIRERIPGDPSEVTLEVNPGRSDTRAARQWRGLGIDRLSVGLQALDDAALRRLGRAHRAEEGRQGLARCLDAGFENLSVDLIYGIPDQTETQLLAAVEELLDLGIPHVSTYALTLEPGTPFGRAAAAGRLSVVSEGVVRRLGRRVRAQLAAGGVLPYEISSAARPGFEARHNSRYWQRRCVLGLGVSAASLLSERRFQNPRRRSAWESALERGQLPLEDYELLDPVEQQRETLALGLRQLRGISRSAYARRFGCLPEDSFPTEFAELFEFELLEQAWGRIRLSDRGVQLADEVFGRLMLAQPSSTTDDRA